MRAGVEFINADKVTTFRGAGVEHYDFAGKRIAFLTAADPGLLNYIHSREPSGIVLFAPVDPIDFTSADDTQSSGPGMVSAPPPGTERSVEIPTSDETGAPVVQIDLMEGDGWPYEGEPFDYVFFDRDKVSEFDDVEGAYRLGEWLTRNLSRSGVCFALFRTGMIQSDWDVFNSIVLTPEGRLPSSPYFYERLMGRFAVRPLVRVTDPARRYGISRVFRLARRSQTLLLVVGQSQAGKTTLARELRANSPHSHLASDYIFFNLFQLRAEKKVPGRGGSVSKLLGSGSAEATGNFFRLIERDDQLLFEYLDTACYLMPPEPNIVSMDIDLREPEAIEKARTYLSDRGFSVWLVTRDLPVLTVQAEEVVETRANEDGGSRFQDRISLAAACPDLSRLKPAEGAGEVSELQGRRMQKMHFGRWLTADTYYGDWMTELIQRCRGAHEPQEEVAFAEVLEHLPPNPVMLELGGYWCFYSIWLGHRYPGAAQLIVEPIGERRSVGRENLEINNNPAELIRAVIGAEPGLLKEFRNGDEIERDIPVITVDQLAQDRGIERIDLLHADIQGFELQMLRGAERMIGDHKISWIFVSTHRWLEDGKKLDLHAECQKFLTARGYKIVADHTPEESYSVDGLLVAKAPGVGGPDRIELSKRMETAS